MIRRFLAGTFVALLLVLPWGAPAFAADFVVPEQSIAGAEQSIPLGEFVDISVTSIKHKPEHLAGTSYTWKLWEVSSHSKLLEKRFRPYKEEGRDGIYFGAGIKNRRLKAICVITHLFIVKEDAKVTEVSTRTVVLTADIIIGADPGPEPGPGPEPTPPEPTPSFPDGKYALAKKSYELAVSRVSAGEDRKKAATALSSSFRGIASAIAAGTLTDPAKILKDTTAANLSAVQNAGVSRAAWEPFFRDLQDAIYTLYTDKKINNASDFKLAWEEIATGLAAVK